jgi:hypothetical protein
VEIVLIQIKEMNPYKLLEDLGDLNNIKALKKFNQ